MMDREDSVMKRRSLLFAGLAALATPFLPKALASREVNVDVGDCTAPPPQGEPRSSWANEKGPPPRATHELHYYDGNEPIRVRREGEEFHDSLVKYFQGMVPRALLRTAVLGQECVRVSCTARTTHIHIRVPVTRTLNKSSAYIQLVGDEVQQNIADAMDTSKGRCASQLVCFDGEERLEITQILDEPRKET